MSRLRCAVTAARRALGSRRSRAARSTDPRSGTGRRVAPAASDLRAALPMPAMQRCLHGRAVWCRSSASLRRGRDRSGSVHVRGGATHQPADPRSDRRHWQFRGRLVDHARTVAGGGCAGGPVPDPSPAACCGARYGRADRDGARVVRASRARFVSARRASVRGGRGDCARCLMAIARV